MCSLTKYKIMWNEEERSYPEEKWGKRNLLPASIYFSFMFFTSIQCFVFSYTIFKFAQHKVKFSWGQSFFMSCDIRNSWMFLFPFFMDEQRQRRRRSENKNPAKNKHRETLYKSHIYIVCWITTKNWASAGVWSGAMAARKIFTRSIKRQKDDDNYKDEDGKEMRH